MAQRTHKKRMTLSEHLALRAQAAQEAQMREDERQHTIRALKALDALPGCMCPACVKLRQAREGSS